jgi:hypothetical protein
VGSEHRHDDATTGPATGSPDDGRLPQRQLLLCVAAHRVTPVSLQNGIYTYTWGTQVEAMLDTNMTPATFEWHIVFDDNCTMRSYGTLTYFGIANN